jgi:hypothetical protein
VEPRVCQHVSIGEAAFEQLHPVAVPRHLHFPGVRRIRMTRGHGTPARSGSEGVDGGRDHRIQRVAPEPAPGQAPQVELVRLADVQPVDGVAPVDEAGYGEQLVTDPTAQPPECGRNGRRRVRPQQPGLVEIAGVAPVARGAVGRIAERVVVVDDGDDTVAAMHADGYPPELREALEGDCDERLHRVLALRRIGEVAQLESCGQLLVRQVHVLLAFGRRTDRPRSVRRGGSSARAARPGQTGAAESV